ncbi:uncharacterized protein NECHADRAFT_93840 [Fusarium vanettenii 77-13-4]|uniref:WW domain-containing protein n=1 Tax=Fusarium vanettenii (strain ATCC MYA-4622 / CBS 123669 / FGSC 9596 / NRRL 45880 / 77-13-4) TaxID=660122 RepID=C7YSH8_FUSV7|nr:uncharacterized protein NECHADRAFT_93840 [Fusarium vanettenii 77-13-4]EEU45249.1 predicted protein [Fusarium vanettenii 77-13-4]
MSFFKKLTKELENFGIGDKDKDEKKDESQYYAAPPQPQYQPPSDKPPLPEGWTAQFDQQHQRWYYVEVATGRTQWEAPGQHAPPPAMVVVTEVLLAMAALLAMGGYGSPSPGYGGYGSPPPPAGYGSPPPPGGYGGAPGYGSPSPYGAPGYGAPGGGYPHQDGGHNPYGNEGERGGEKKKSGSSGMLLGAAGGLAVGAVGGALIANALDDSDSEHEHAAPAPAPVTHTEYNEYNQYREAPPADYNDPYAQDGPPAVLPPTDADGDSVSSSDREDVQEAREEYEEALADAADSDASSSDQEALEEAREEYEEAYEEVYED